MSRELRKDPKHRQYFDQRASQALVVSPIKRPNKRPQQSANGADDAVDAVEAMVQLRRLQRAIANRQPSRVSKPLTPPQARPPPSMQPPVTGRHESPDVDIFNTPSVLWYQAEFL
jgi:hypothetical protein